METTHTYVIVGAGLAGVNAAEGIRERDRSGSILLLGREQDAHNRKSTARATSSAAVALEWQVVREPLEVILA